VKTAPVPVEEAEITAAALLEAEQLRNPRYSKAAVARYMRERFGEAEVLRSENLPLSDDNDYVMSILAVVNASDRNAFYCVRPLEGTCQKGRYTIPNVEFVRKRGQT
jgi:hypothetical protein